MIIIKEILCFSVIIKRHLLIAFLFMGGGSGFRFEFAAVVSLTICIIVAGCSAQSISSPQSVSGDFGRNWISSFKAQNPQPAEQNLKNDLWSWGGSPKGSIVVNGNLLPDPYYFWKSLNYTRGWLGKVSIDPATGYPVYGYIDPYTGMPFYFYVDPRTRKPVYTYVDPFYDFPSYDGMPPYYASDYLPIGNGYFGYRM